ncbi:methyltransferase domain-containing protein [Angustibacter speluncae]
MIFRRFKRDQQPAQPVERDRDEEYLDLLIEGLEHGREGVPSGPPADVQARFVGWSGGEALRECFGVYRICKQALAVPVGEADILDFGVGWGRLIRFYGRDADLSRLHGVDVDGEILQVCRDTGVPGQLQQIQPDGSLPYDDASMDLVYAFSVFSHLSEDAAAHWVTEIERVLRPGGALVLTTQGERFLAKCAGARRKSDANEFERAMGGWFEDPQAALEGYRQGRFAYAATGGGGVLTADFYGWAAMPAAWVASHAPGLHEERLVDDPSVNEQVVMVLRRR